MIGTAPPARFDAAARRAVLSGRPMRCRTRYLLAATLVATTLCADRAAFAEPRAAAEPARGLVDRLTDGFRRTVATPPVVRQRCPWATVTTVRPAPPVRSAPAVVTVVCPACLPLPPPLA